MPSLSGDQPPMRPPTTGLEWSVLIHDDLRVALDWAGPKAAEAVCRAIDLVAHDANRILGELQRDETPALGLEVCRAVESELLGWPRERAERFLLNTAHVLLTLPDGPFLGAAHLQWCVEAALQAWLTGDPDEGETLGYEDSFRDLEREAQRLAEQAKAGLEQFEPDEDEER